MSELNSLTPKQTVQKLDQYIIGQGDAKRSVAIALRNRWRRQQVLQMLHEMHLLVPLRTLGYGNKFIDQAPQQTLWKNAGIDVAGIIKGALEVMKQGA
ncbi:MAG: hypothetical protein D3922_17020 [Candidatus Electrothrix sp. AR1]|nr:hypothetical protein [Candidatus Electrothrix sp. AR1]